MRKLLGSFFNLLTLLLILLLIAIGVLMFVVDPERYRQPLEQQVLADLGLQVEIAGDISLFLRPYIGVTLQDLRIRDPQLPRELGSVSTLQIKVDAWRLLQGQLVLQELIADHVHINWYTDTDGYNPWELLLRQQRDRTRPVVADGEIQNLLQLVSVSAGTIDIQNYQRATHYSIRNLGLTARESNSVDRAFRMRAEFDWFDTSGQPPRHLLVSSLNRANLGTGDVSVEEFLLTFTPVLLQGDLEIRDMFANTSWSGKLTSNVFSLQDLLSNLNLTDGDSTPISPPTLTRPSTDEMSLQVTFNGDNQQLRIPSATVTLGSMQANSDAIVRYSGAQLPPVITYRINTNGLDLTPYFAAGSVPGNTPVAEGLSPDVITPPPVTAPFELPLRWFRGKTIQGTLSIESLRYGALQTGFLNVFTNLEDGVLDLEVQPELAGGGTARGSLRVDGRATEARVNLQFHATGAGLSSEVLPLFQQDSLSGLLDLESSFDTWGNTLGAWQENLSGYAGFRLNQSLVDIGVIKQVFTAITTLSPTAEPIQQWPDAVRFSTLGGYLAITNGLHQDQQFRIRMDNIDLAGNGGFDFATNSFSYRTGFTILGLPMPQAVTLNERYQNVQWPVQCSAGFDADISQFCRPDFQQVRELFMDLETGRLSPRLDDILSAPVPELLSATAQLMLPGLPVVQ